MNIYSLKNLTSKQYFLIIFYSILAGVSFYFSGIAGIINLFISLVLYSVLFYFFYYIWKHSIRKKEYRDYVPFLEWFLVRISIFITLLFSILGSFTYYENEISPAKMPRITISNGIKTVEFQAMIHIGRKEFYEEIKNHIYTLKKDGFVLFFEGVKPGKEENMKKFDDALGVQFTPDLYENFSKLYGVTFQDNDDFLGLVNNLDFNVDLSIDEIIKYYDEKKEKSETKKLPQEAQDINSLVLDKLSQLNNKELQLLVYVNKAILNILIKSDGAKNGIISSFANKDLFDVILHKRNDVVSTAVIKSEYNKIVITYGLLHFEGILKNLQKNDPNWKIIKTEYLYPISERK